MIELNILGEILYKVKGKQENTVTKAVQDLDKMREENLQIENRIIFIYFKHAPLHYVILHAVIIYIAHYTLICNFP